MNGQLSDHPLGELIREITRAALSGALRLERERVKLAIYFDEGELHYAASNLRAHRLIEVLQRNSLINDGQLAQLRAATSDDELAASLLRRRAISPETLDKIRSSQVADVLRLALLWTNGAWHFDPRVRLAGDIRAVPRLDQMLMESARRLPPGFVVSRFNGANDTLSRPTHEVNGVNLLPVEAFVLSRVESPITVAELAAISGVPETEALCAVYVLLLGGLLHRTDWPRAIPLEDGKPSGFRGKTTRKRKPVDSSPAPDSAMEDSEGELKAFFDRMDRAQDHFEVLDLGRMAAAADIKRAYHRLARRFHPDRFHQSPAELRRQVDAAFARIAQAYETLSNSSLRAAYEAKLGTKGAATSKGNSSAGTRSANDPVERVFQQGMTALQQNQPEKAVRCLAEAARLAPREARYRAYHGRALAADSKTRRMAESEFLVALSIEPDNAVHRVMLAELYAELGFPRRAQGELDRALAADPKNQQARELQARLRGKR